VEPDPTLIVVAARAERPEELEPLLQTLVSVTTTAPGSMVLVVDDRSPQPSAQLIEAAASELDCAYVLQQDGEGTSAAFNVGLTAAAEHGMDTCLVSAGLTFQAPGWLDRLRLRTASDGKLAPVAGGAVMNPGGTIRQAGYFFSLFRRNWSARLRNVPEIMLDVDDPRACPVSSELQLIRRGLVESVGLYDEAMDGPHAALDYGLRVFASGSECIFEPSVRAHGLSPVEGEPDVDEPAAKRLRTKHIDMSFQGFSPVVLG
jgi:GT2 family glycosyltransferase